MRPITPQPGYTENDTIDAMASGQFIYADCYTFIPRVGSPLRYTTAQQRVSVVPVDYLMRATYERTVLISGLRVKNNLGVEVDEQQIQLDYPDEPLYQAALTWPQALLQGRLDGARIRRDRYIAKEWGSLSTGGVKWLGGMPMFFGLVSTLTSVGRQQATISVKSDLVLLDVQAPKDLFEPNCKNTWGDTGCGINQDDWAVAGTVGASPSKIILPWSAASTEYSLGKIHIENGDSVTRVRTVLRADSTHLYLAYPLDFEPAVGLPFVAFPGCDRTVPRCTHFWGTPAFRDHFAGYPFVPVEETALGNGG